MRKILWLAVAAVGLCLTVPGLGRAGLITFDEQYVAGVSVPVNYGLQRANVLTEAYAAEGVHFSGPNLGDGSVNGGAIVYDPPSFTGPGDLYNFGVLPHSGGNFLAFNRKAQVGGGFFFPPFGGTPLGNATDPETITFDSTQSQVSIWAAGGLQPHLFQIQGFDANNYLVDSQTLTTQDWSELTVSGGGIQSVVLSEIGRAGDSWVYDDLSFTSDSGGVAAVAGGPSNPAPEPGGLVLLSLGGVGLAGWGWRMGKRATLMTA